MLECTPRSHPSLGLDVPIETSAVWLQMESDKDQLILCKNGKQLGNWTISGQFYRPLAGNGWGPKCEPPFPVPEWAVEDEDRKLFSFQP